jgi:hypothetical protein
MNGCPLWVLCVLSGRGVCDGLITRPDESYRLWCVLVCDLETSRVRRLKLVRVVNAGQKKKKKKRQYPSRLSLFPHNPSPCFRICIFNGLIRQFPQMPTLTSDHHSKCKQLQMKNPSAWLTTRRYVDVASSDVFF